MKKKGTPKFIVQFLWSSDISKVDIRRDKAMIIKNVLNFGTKRATDWLDETYSRRDIRRVIRNTPVSAWRQRSLNLWSLIYGVSPKRQTRFS